MARRVVVVGAGVAGLAAAHRLLRDDPDLELTILESDRAPGGRLGSVDVAGLPIEAGPDAFVARKPSAVELCRELGLELDAPGARGAFVWTRRGLVPLPPGALGIPAEAESLLRWPGLSRRGRLRAVGDLVRRSATTQDDEPLGELLRRRLGNEATETLVAPLLAGLFAGDVDHLGVRATFPELAEWERERGSLIRGAKASLDAGRDAGPIFLRPRGGTGELPRALSASVGRERIRTRVAGEGVERDGDAWVVRSGDRLLGADAVVVATPAHVAADILAGVAPAAAAPLRRIAYVSTAVVALVYPDDTGDALPPMTGFVVPAGRAPMTAATFLSRKWPEAAFGTRAVLRCFVGAAGSEDVLEADDDEIVDAVCRHLAALLPLPERPTHSAVVRWPRSMPQFEVGHLELVRAIDEGLPPGIVVAGNATLGVGVADAVRSAHEAADRVRMHLTRSVGTETR
jgi:oxygen-dependent protoporphyrinogen oxidase